MHLKNLCSYMAARCKINAALASNDSDQLSAAEKYLQALILRDQHSEYRSDMEDLLDTLNYETSSPADSLDRLVKLVTMPHGNRFGNAVANLTFLLHSYFDEHGNRLPQDGEDKDPPADIPVEKYDLTDWLITLHQPDETWEFYGVDQKKQLEQQQKQRGLHALERWHKTHSLPWLVAALSLNDLLDKSNRDLLLAATKTPAQSKAFCTAQFYVADSLLRSNRKAEANLLLSRILARNDLPPSTRNLFLCQKLVASKSVIEYLNSIAQRPVAITTNFDPGQLPENWMSVEAQSKFYSIDKVIAETQTNDLNANLPQSYWVRWSGDRTLPSSLRSRIVLAAWLRSTLLGEEANLDDQLVEAYPSLRKGMTSYKASQDSAEKRFALACLIISNWGMTPYLEPGVSRHGSKFNEWDNFNANFWLPLAPTPLTAPKAGSANVSAPQFYEYLGSSVMRSRLQLYSKPALRALLTDAERKQADSERLAIWKNHPSKFLGDAIISWAKAHPKDPRVPEMLYHLVKLPRWSPGRTDIGTKYSREGYLLLHKQYPNNPWTAKAEYWY
jgi:hypothetical protein